MEKIKVCIVGYGNLGRGVKTALKKSENGDIELVAILSRRPGQVQEEVKDVPVFHNDTYPLPGGISPDVAILCGGSKEDLPKQGPVFAARWNTVDSFDTHPKIIDYYENMEVIALENGNVCIICQGWDPGILSKIRVLVDAILPGCKIYTFWGDPEKGGFSQGHANAAGGVEGAKRAAAYTFPIKEAIERIRKGETPEFTKREMHKRKVYVVLEERADKEAVRKRICSMPDYFDEYDTEVIFINEEEIKRDHSDYFHGGFVLASGETGDGNRQIIEFKLNLSSNPEFTGSVLVAYARAAYRMNKEGIIGARIVSDVSEEMISPREKGDLLRNFI